MMKKRMMKKGKRERSSSNGIGRKRFHQPAGNSPLSWKIRLAKLTNQFFPTALIEATGTSTEFSKAK